MAEVLVSPGVLARENDQTFLEAQPVQAGAAIVGPTVKGPVGIPTLITTYSEYQNVFGTTVESGSGQFTYLTSISAFNYFQQGGDSLLVTRVVSGSFTSATSTTIANGQNITGAAAATGSLTIAGTFGQTVDDEFQITVGGSEFRFIAADPAGGLPADSNPVFFLATGSNTAGYIDNLVTKIDGASIGVNATDATTAIQLTASSAGTAGNLISVDTGSGTTFSDVLTLEGGVAGVGSTNAFTLKTISEGVIANSDGAEGTNNTLANGTSDNVRWEIVNPNVSTGTFSLLIRRGDDASNDKVVLETFANLSMDPNSSDYIEKVVGNSKQTVTADGTEYYIKNEGTYLNRSKFVYVDSVSTPTLNYFDNNGDAKTALTSSIPVASSGSFNSATGTVFTAANSPALFYETINNTNSQGFDAAALGDTTSNGTYAVAFNLLANQDDFQFNLITAPGLIKGNGNASSELTTLVNNAQSRGDNLAVIDLVNWNSTISTVTAGATAVDSSYAATYWPWLQTIDPDTNKTVWVPASTMIPGVYAFNDRSAEAWFAPAGLNRGSLTTVVRAERKLTNGNRNTLYTSNVNPIATFPNSGVVVFGQKTLQKKASALDRVNVRRLLIELKSFISQVADNLVFEQNTATTRNNFLSQVNPFLSSVQQRQGLFAFRVVMDDSNNTPDVIDRNQLVGQIFIQPTRTAEFIYLDFNILPTGATFPS